MSHLTLTGFWSAPLQKLFKMYNRSPANKITSSKSISTSTTFRNRSPSIQGFEPHSPKEASRFRSDSFIDTNIDSLGNLKHLLANEQDIIEYHKVWCTDVCRKIDSIFATITSHIQNVLTDEQIKMKKEVENDYCQFLSFMKDAKNQIRSFYANKEQLQSQKILSLTRRFEIDNNDYYSGRNLELRSPFEEQNKQREKFKVLNNFYSSNQEFFAELNQQAEEHLQFRERLQEKSQQFEYILDRFRQTIDYSISKMVETCNQFLRHDRILQ